MEHTRVSFVRLLTLTWFGSVVPISRSGERTVAADADTLERPEAETAADPSVSAYLDLLKKDIDGGILGRFHKAAIASWEALVAHVKIDRENDRIEGDVGL